MDKIKTIYDITVTLRGEAVATPSIMEYSSERHWKLEEGEFCNLSILRMTSHNGTHVDVPWHYFSDRARLDEIPIERWILPAHVVSIKDKEMVRLSELENLNIRPGDALLFKTNNSVSGIVTRKGVAAEFVSVSPEAGDFCIKKKLGLVGIDYCSIDRPAGERGPVHLKLLGNDILIAEGIDLSAVPPGKYTLFCLPLKLEGSDGAPARAVLVR